MSDYAFVADRARKAFASVARLESALAANPHDRSLLVNLTSMRRRAEQERLQLERLAAINQIEICHYRLVPEGDSEYGLAHVAKSLLEYQYLFSQIYDAHKNGAKSRAVLGHEAEAESRLEFAYSYSGSLGVALLAASERDLLSGNLDQPIELLFHIMEIGNVDSVKEVAHSLGRAVVKRVHDWSQANVEGGFATDIRWKRSDGRMLGQMVGRKRLEHIVDYIEQTSDAKTTCLDVRGMLVAGNIGRGTFQISVPEGPTYSGRFAKDALLADDLILGKFYDAEMELSEVYYYATEVTQRFYTLNKLIGPIGSGA